MPPPARPRAVLITGARAGRGTGHFVTNPQLAGAGAGAGCCTGMDTGALLDPSTHTARGTLSPAGGWTSTIWIW